jgi:group I intron endonuclease
MEHSGIREPYGLIYLIRNRVNGKVYIGQTMRPLATRWIEHQSVAKLKRSSVMLHNAIRKYGASNFDFVELHRAYSREELDEMERRAIWTQDATDKRYGYNMKSGGARGELTEEALEKMRKASTGKHPSAETRAKMSAAHKAIWQTQEYRQQQREARTFFQSEEYKAKHRANTLRLGQTPEYKDKIRRASLAMWANPAYRARHAVAMAKARARQQEKAKHQ